MFESLKNKKSEKLKILWETIELEAWVGAGGKEAQPKSVPNQSVYSTKVSKLHQVSRLNQSLIFSKKISKKNFQKKKNY